MKLGQAAEVYVMCRHGEQKQQTLSKQAEQESCGENN